MKQDSCISAFVFTTLLLLSGAVIASYVYLIHNAMHPAEFPEREKQSTSYSDPANAYRAAKTRTLLWADLGRFAHRFHFRTGEGEYQIELPGAQAGRHWPQEDPKQVSWHMRLDSESTLRIRPTSSAGGFKEAAYVLGLYLVDDAWSYRALSVTSGGYEQVVDSMYPGKWVFLHLSETDFKHAELQVSIRPLIGYGSLLSAVALLEVRPEHSRKGAQ